MKKNKAFPEAVFHTGAGSVARKAFTSSSVTLLAKAVIALNVVLAPLLYWFTGMPAILWGAFSEVLLMLLVIRLNTRRKIHTASLLFFLVMNVATFYFAAILGKELNVQLMIIFLMGLSGFLYEHKLFRLIGAGISLASFGLLEYIYRHDAVTTLPLANDSRIFLRWMLLLGMGGLIALLFHLYSKVNRYIAKELEQRQETLEQDLLKALYANDRKKSFLREVVHEIKSGFNPIEGMVAYLGQKERLERSNVNTDQLIAHIKSGCFSYRRLLGNLLEFSRIEYDKVEAPILESVAIRPFMQQLVNEFQYTAITERTHIELHILPNMPETVTCDPIKLRQIAHNLIHNAIKFVQPGHPVRVNLQLVDAGNWQLQVINDGEGFAPEKIREFFHPYQPVRTGINLEGNGLGLFITKQLVSSLQGNIEMTRQEQHTVMEVTFPITKPVIYARPMPASA